MVDIKKTHGGARYGAGRKPAEEPKRPVNVRMTDSEICKLKKAADADGKSLSQYMRDVVLASIS